MAKPTARALAGMATDRLANSPGRMIAKHEVSAMLATTVSHTVGASANAAANTPAAMATTRRNLNTRAGSRRNNLVPIAAPIARPMNWNGSTEAAR